MVTCGQCRYFVRDSVGDGSGIGSCKQLTDYITKINHLSYSQRFGLIKKAERELDIHSRLQWPDVERNCKKFSQKLQVVS